MFASASSQHGRLVQGNATQEAKAEATDPLWLRLIGYTMSLLRHSAGHSESQAGWTSVWEGTVTQVCALGGGFTGSHLGRPASPWRWPSWLASHHPWVTFNSSLSAHRSENQKAFSSETVSRDPSFLTSSPSPKELSPYLIPWGPARSPHQYSCPSWVYCHRIPHGQPATAAGDNWKYNLKWLRSFISDIMSKLVSPPLPVLSNRPLFQTAALRAMFLMQVHGAVSGLLESLCRMEVPGTHPRLTESEPGGCGSRGLLLLTSPLLIRLQV